MASGSDGFGGGRLCPSVWDSNRHHRTHSGTEGRPVPSRKNSRTFGGEPATPPSPRSDGSDSGRNERLRPHWDKNEFRFGRSVSPGATSGPIGTIFGGDPTTYDSARLPYPPRVFDLLVRRCGLGQGKAIFEIGPGTGIATRELLRCGARSLTLIEPDRRLTRYLRRSLGPCGTEIRILQSTFEGARLPTASFDLGVAASSFHWVRPRPGLKKVARVLRTEGWFVFWNNHHRDPFHPSPFHHALDALYRELGGNLLSVWHGMGSDAQARAAYRNERSRTLAELRSIGSFERVRCEPVSWQVTLETNRMVRLWSTFSDTLSWPPRRRAWFLNKLQQLVERQFAGRVTLPMLTTVCSARRN